MELFCHYYHHVSFCKQSLTYTLSKTNLFHFESNELGNATNQPLPVCSDDEAELTEHTKLYHSQLFKYFPAKIRKNTGAYHSTCW